jgi:Transglutaminase-like superfamily
MKHLGRFYRLPTSERWLLARAALLLGAIRVGLWLLPFRTLRSLLDRATVFYRVRETDYQSTDLVVWAVEVAAKHMPGFDTCLTRALAAQVLLSRRGHPAVLRIGVVKSAVGKFEAHAWVESDGRVVIGGHELERYTPLAALGGEGS